MNDPSTESADSRALPASTALEQPPAAGTLLAGRYEVLRVLGSGGSAVVCAVRDRELRGEVALKLLHPSRSDETSLKRLRREVALTRSISNPHLIRIFDIGQSEYGPFLTMELCKGDTLRSRISTGPLPVEEAIRVTTEVLEGLEAIHSLGIIHRDVKPSNVLIDSSGAVKVADLGLALRTSADQSRLTRTDGLLGTLEYLSPEQAMGEELDPRTDLYSLGIALYEMLTGKLPFEARSSIGTVVAHLRTRPPSPRDLRPEVPRWLARFAGRLLEKNRTHRYGSATDALRAIRRRRVLWRPRAWRAALAGVTLLASVSAATWGYRQTRFDRMIHNGEKLEALDRRGAVLWSIPNWTGLDVFRDMRSREGKRIAVIRRGLSGLLSDQRTNHLLLLYDAQTGQVVRTVRLPTKHFGQFRDTYSAEGSPMAVDIDGDGDDELLVWYGHTPYWPSYTDYYDPREDLARVVLIASGHHLPEAAVDLDGDGRKEVIFSGINNRMGWHPAIAAVAIPRGPADPAETPDASLGEGVFQNLVWYALLPPGMLLSSDGRVRVDQAHRRIIVEYINHKTVQLDFDGFIAGSRTATKAIDRRRLRNDAYEDLRQSVREAMNVHLEPALARSKQAIRLAQQAGDSLLAEWAARIRLQQLIRSGRRDAAETEAGRLVASSEAASDICYDVGQALMLRGEMTAAARWYVKALAVGDENHHGRSKYELLEGAVLSLSSLKRWSEAMEEIRAFDAAYPTEHPFAAVYAEYVQWRSGMPIHRWDTLRGDLPDFILYVDLEAQYRLSGDARAALARLDGLVPRMSTVRAPMLLLRARLLEALGRRTEAWQAATAGLDQARQDSGDDEETLALFDVILDRYARIARASRHEAEARAADTERARHAAQIR